MKKVILIMFASAVFLSAMITGCRADPEYRKLQEDAESLRAEVFENGKRFQEEWGD